MAPQNCIPAAVPAIDQVAVPEMQRHARHTPDPLLHRGGKVLRPAQVMAKEGLGNPMAIRRERNVAASTKWEVERPRPERPKAPWELGPGEAAWPRGDPVARRGSAIWPARLPGSILLSAKEDGVRSETNVACGRCSGDRSGGPGPTARSSGNRTAAPRRDGTGEIPASIPGGESGIPWEALT